MTTQQALTPEQAQQNKGWMAQQQYEIVQQNQNEESQALEAASMTNNYRAPRFSRPQSMMEKADAEVKQVGDAQQAIMRQQQSELPRVSVPRVSTSNTITTIISNQRLVKKERKTVSGGDKNLESGRKKTIGAHNYDPNIFYQQ